MFLVSSNPPDPKFKISDSKAENPNLKKKNQDSYKMKILAVFHNSRLTVAPLTTPYALKLSKKKKEQ